jgi:hypothetical protein
VLKRDREVETDIPEPNLAGCGGVQFGSYNVLSNGQILTPDQARIYSMEREFPV